MRRQANTQTDKQTNKFKTHKKHETVQFTNKQLIK